MRMGSHWEVSSALFLKGYKDDSSQCQVGWWVAFKGTWGLINEERWSLGHVLYLFFNHQKTFSWLTLRRKAEDDRIKSNSFWFWYKRNNEHWSINVTELDVICSLGSVQCKKSFECHLLMKATHVHWVIADETTWILLRGCDPTVNTATTRPWPSIDRCRAGTPSSCWRAECRRFWPPADTGVFITVFSVRERRLVGAGGWGAGGRERCWTATAACESSLEGLTLHLP